MGERTAAAKSGAAQYAATVGRRRHSTVEWLDVLEWRYPIGDDESPPHSADGLYRHPHSADGFEAVEIDDAPSSCLLVRRVAAPRGLNG